MHNRNNIVQNGLGISLVVIVSVLVVQICGGPGFRRSSNGINGERPKAVEIENKIALQAGNSIGTSFNQYRK